ncbi:MAG: c-type cytochrome [Chitinophagales bacterium]
MSIFKNIFCHKKVALLTLLLSLFVVFSNANAQVGCDNEAYKQGESIFKANCASCHKINQNLTGPALAGVYDKYDRDWLYAWIKNSQALVKAGDADAVKIFNEYNKSVMTAQNLKNEQIDQVLAYIEQETKAPCTVAGDGGETGEAGGTNSVFLIFLGIISSILLVIFFALGRVNSALSSMVKEKLGQLVPEPVGIDRKIFNKKNMALVSILAIIALGYYTVDSATALGRQQGYQPEQPIKFSHKLHAGVQQIECQYCHSGAAKGKSAVIPSANVCMNCHKGVTEGPKYGKTEIAKIYDAVGWDPEKSQYIEGYKEKPIEWIRIHNLPDHVYFNHSQHVTAGKQECQTCHGPIEEMEVVEQHSSLGMGWCINCHRQTEVDFRGNDYYSVYEQFHKDLKDEKINKVTVEDIGGTECQKCHY